jgi:hypothetical protein
MKEFRVVQWGKGMKKELHLLDEEAFVNFCLPGGNRFRLPNRMERV